MKEIIEEWGECVLYMVYGLIVVGAIILFLKCSNGSWANNVVMKALIGNL